MSGALFQMGSSSENLHSGLSHLFAGSLFSSRQRKNALRTVCGPTFLWVYRNTSRIGRRARMRFAAKSGALFRPKAKRCRQLLVPGTGYSTSGAALSRCWRDHALTSHSARPKMTSPAAISSGTRREHDPSEIIPLSTGCLRDRKAAQKPAGVHREPAGGG